MSRPCTFYGTPRGCKRGSSCTFLHNEPSGGGGTTSSPSAATTGPSATGPVPNGVCRNYWTSGNCTWGSKCKYQHRRPGEPQVASNGDAIPPAPYNTCRLYWTSGSCRNGLACKFNHIQFGQTSEATQSPQASVTNLARGPSVTALGSSHMDMPPQRAYKYIEPMLSNNFDFRGRTAQIYTFLNVLEGSNGPAWVRLRHLSRWLV